MIPPDRHTREWIVAQQVRLGMADPLILEKAVFALTLLDLLGRTDLDFVLKGGTALLLHLPRPNRLSIDIDIVCKTPKPDFESALAELLGKSPFLRWDEPTRGERGLPGRRHYRFHFQSPTQRQEMHILLDVLTEPNVLTHIVECPVNTAFLEIAEPTAVKTPRLESLLADKLTAFAPGTVGVPLTAQFSQQVIKQLFDIAQLGNHLVSVPFRLPEAKVAAAKAARLAMLLKASDLSVGLPVFDPAVESLKEQIGCS